MQLTKLSNPIPCAGHFFLSAPRDGVRFSSVQSLDRSGRQEIDSAEILFRSFLQVALVSSSGMGKYVHSLMLSPKHFLCRPRRHAPSKVP